jgi:hypothetical protein
LGYADGGIEINFDGVGSDLKVVVAQHPLLHALNLGARPGEIAVENHDELVAHPRDKDSQVIIHVRMLENENGLQQEALGIVGVNLLYAAFFLHYKPHLMLESLLDNLTTARIEIDMVEFSGIEFRHVDNRVMSLKLVQLGLSGAAIFGPTGEVLQPSELLRKRAILVERGSFRPVTKVNMDMVRCAHDRFASEPEVKEKQVVQLMEITMRNLLAAGGD